MNFLKSKGREFFSLWLLILPPGSVLLFFLISVLFLTPLTTVFLNSIPPFSDNFTCSSSKNSSWESIPIHPQSGGNKRWVIIRHVASITHGLFIGEVQGLQNKEIEKEKCSGKAVIFVMITMKKVLVKATLRFPFPTDFSDQLLLCFQTHQGFEAGS